MLEKVSEFFNPTAIIDEKHNKNDGYAQRCGVNVIKLFEFLKVIDKQQVLFQHVLNALSYLHGNEDIQCPRKIYISLKTPFFRNSPRYGEIGKEVDVKYQKRIDSSEKVIFSNNLCLGITQKIEGNLPNLCNLKTKVTLQRMGKILVNEFNLTTIEFLGDGFSGQYPFIPTEISIDNKIYPFYGYICHSEISYNGSIKLLSIFFNLCFKPMLNSSDKMKRKKLREIATLEWLFQQVSPYRRGTPTYIKILVSALLLFHGFAPQYDCIHNDLNCFNSFTKNLSEYLKEWPLYTPYVDNKFLLSRNQQRATWMHKSKNHLPRCFLASFKMFM